MPLLGFTKLYEKLLDGTKTQTIRRPRKHPLKVGDKLFVYWKLRTKECEKLGEAIVTSIVRKSLIAITEEEAIKDGFENRADFFELFLKMHRDARFYDEFDIIAFEWTHKEA